MERIHKLATEPAFSDALKKYVQEGSRVYRADRPTERAAKLDPEDPSKSVSFYYQVRSNIVHRGKSLHNDVSLVHRCLEQLNAIFQDLLDSTLGKRSDR
jgi:hypothetical protein